MYPCEPSILDSVHDDVQDDGTPVDIAIDEREAENYLPPCFLQTISALIFCIFVRFDFCFATWRVTDCQPRSRIGG
jgi:hypothetical protein